MPRKPKVVPVDIVRTLTLCMKTLSELYPNDQTRPGLVTAWLHDKQHFYASFARYEPVAQPPGQFNLHPDKKVVIAWGTGATLEEAIKDLLQRWQGNTIYARQLLTQTLRATKKAA